METNLQKIQKIVDASELLREEKDDFVTLLTLATDTELGPMAQLLSEDKSQTSKIYQNIKAKSTALATGDSVLWQKIIQEEEAQLKELER
ncbi:MAG: hypothetical protein Q7S82_03480 [bacterium]|nr:hypothetical protein [bacterium]